MDHQQKLIEALDYHLRQARLGQIDGAIVITTLGSEVTKSSWTGIRRAALPELAIVLQGYATRAVELVWRGFRSDPIRPPELRAVDPEDEA